MSSKRKVNAEWHAAHLMPGNPSKEERVRWHYEHAEACGCRPVPEGLSDDVRMMSRQESGRSA